MGLSSKYCKLCVHSLRLISKYVEILELARYFRAGELNSSSLMSVIANISHYPLQGKPRKFGEVVVSASPTNFFFLINENECFVNNRMFEANLALDSINKKVN